MSLAFSILRAAHASGTHHKLALDALLDLQGPGAEEWQRLFLSNAKLYIDGSKAPDKEFKDFKNHVLHPGDDYWGGAPEKARNWYGHLVEALKSKNWSEAAWCAGILSHYYTDPAMPFHTAQSEAENAIHRATEWSISKSYDALVREAKARKASFAPPAGKTENWIAEYVCLTADTSHQLYERLIAHYDFNVGVVEPENGLDPVARELVGDMLVFARTGFACLLARAIKEAAVEPPKTNLSAQSIIATLTIPARWVLNKIADAQTRRQVEAMYDELMATGKVEQNLPEDDRAIRDLYEKEVVAPRRAQKTAERAKRIASGADRTQRHTLLDIAKASKANTTNSELGQPMLMPAADSAPATTRPATTAATAYANETSTTASKPAAEKSNERQLSSYQPKSKQRSERFYLKTTDDVEAGPSVGPKTAERLAEIGIYKVSDLLAADPATVANGLNDSRITAPTVQRWQDEARLMLTIPGLRVTQSLILVGAGYRYTEDIAEAKPEELSAAILAFAATQSGQRLLRDGEPPDIEKLKSWIDAANQAAEAA